jgi:hypothetical protein
MISCWHIYRESFDNIEICAKMDSYHATFAAPLLTFTRKWCGINPNEKEPQHYVTLK